MLTTFYLLISRLRRLNASLLLQLVISALFFPLVTSANNDIPGNEEDKVKWYQIEYIMFEHLQTDDHILRYEDTPYPKKQNKQYSYLTSITQPSSPYQFTQLNEDKMDLFDALTKLKNSRAVSVLDMGAWQQPLKVEKDYPPLRIEKSVSKHRSLFGEIQLKKSRYTHAALKLFLGNPISVPYENITDWFLDNNTAWHLIDLITPLQHDSFFTQSIGTSKLYNNLLYLSESRRIKEGEIHYIDHPVVSAIITMKEIPSPLFLLGDLSYAE